MSLSSRVDKLAEMLRARQEASGLGRIVKAVKGAQDRNAVLDAMVADGEISETDRESVLIIRHIVVPWKYQDTAPDREQAAFALLAKRENKSPSVSNGGKPNGVLR